MVDDNHDGSGKARVPVVGIIMGSSSDLPTMGQAADELDRFGVPHEVRVVSAHRSPLRMVEYAQAAAGRGLRVIIAGAGGAAHLPGMVASLTALPVIGVPVQTRALGGVDSLHSIVQMPGGVPVATMAIGGARNAGLMAVRILALSDDRLSEMLAEHQNELARHAAAQDAEINPADPSHRPTVQE